jgi:hypothetical protein
MTHCGASKAINQRCPTSGKSSIRRVRQRQAGATTATSDAEDDDLFIVPQKRPVQITVHDSVLTIFLLFCGSSHIPPPPQLFNTSPAALQSPPPPSSLPCFPYLLSMSISLKPSLPQRSQRQHFMSKKAVASLMAEVASSSSDESSNRWRERTLNVLSFRDCLAGRRVSLALVPNGILQSPAQLRAPIMKSLELVMAEARFSTLRSPLCKRRRQQALPPLGSVVAECSPCGRVRLIFPCVAFSCQRLATAPADTHMTFMSWSWAEMVMERVTRGRVKKVQVVTYGCSGARAVLCAALVVPVLVCAVGLTRAAGNGGWF